MNFLLQRDKSPGDRAENRWMHIVKRLSVSRETLPYPAFPPGAPFVYRRVAQAGSLETIVIGSEEAGDLAAGETVSS